VLHHSPPLNVGRRTLFALAVLMVNVWFSGTSDPLFLWIFSFCLPLFGLPLMSRSLELFRPMPGLNMIEFFPPGLSAGGLLIMVCSEPLPMISSSLFLRWVNLYSVPLFPTHSFVHRHSIPSFSYARLPSPRGVFLFFFFHFSVLRTRPQSQTPSSKFNQPQNTPRSTSGFCQPGPPIPFLLV